MPLHTFPLLGGTWYIITQLAIYTSYISGIYIYMYSANWVIIYHLPPITTKPKKTATPPKFNSSPLKIGNPKRKLIFQASIFRGELLNFQGVLIVYLFFLRSLGIDFSDPRRGLPLICKRLKPGMQAERNEARQVGREIPRGCWGENAVVLLILFFLFLKLVLPKIRPQNHPF